MDAMLMPPRFVNTPAPEEEPFQEGERNQLADMASSNIQRLLKASAEDALPLATTPLGTIIAMNTGEGFIVTVETSDPHQGDHYASSVDELRQLPLELLGQIWLVSQSEIRRGARQQFTGSDAENLRDNAPLPSEDPDDPAPIDDSFDEDTLPLPAFLTEKQKS